MAGLGGTLMPGRRKRREVRRPRQAAAARHRGSTTPPDHRAIPTAPESERPAWLLITGGLTALAAGVALSITLGQGFVFVCLLGGLAYALGVSGLSQRKWIALPAFVLGLLAPFVLTFGVHSVLMQRIGHAEMCAVSSKEEHPSAKYPRVDYVLACPGGEVELDLDWNDRLKGAEAPVAIGEPLRPLWGSYTRWNLLLVSSVPGAMILLVPVARLLRKQP
ncbi:hypothetical protein [Lentzea sp. NBRC 102530]|uniref:hypothetical protein n=1 Tax=Lentzea sp. NBRC 102530 TaxID=3032201 RepID=UPI0024A35F53|nr:hypothetical protein [Lentzea sp. NBRC 102530]GLY52862.1 hypothetical protein Lesp01_65180 [Lentzea sp. NBRC 102530]